TGLPTVEGSIQVVNLKTGVVAYAVSDHRRDANFGKRSVAENLAKKNGGKMGKDEKIAPKRAEIRKRNVSFQGKCLDRLMLKIKAARRMLTEEPGNVVLKVEVEMFSSIKPGRIKISRLLIATTVVLVLLLSLDRLLYLAERRNQEESISEAEPVAGQG